MKSLLELGRSEAAIQKWKATYKTQELFQIPTREHITCLETNVMTNWETKSLQKTKNGNDKLPQILHLSLQFKREKSIVTPYRPSGYSLYLRKWSRKHAD